MNPNANLARARLGVRHALVFEHVRGAEFVDDDRFHSLPLSTPREPIGPAVAPNACSNGVEKRQSIFTPASRTMRSHLTASALTRSPNSDAVMSAGSMKLASSRFLASGSRPSART